MVPDPDVEELTTIGETTTHCWCQRGSCGCLIVDSSHGKLTIHIDLYFITPLRGSHVVKRALAEAQGAVLIRVANMEVVLGDFRFTITVALAEDIDVADENHA